MRETAVAKERLFCTFRLESNLFGVDILEVKEVTTELTLTKIAHAPDEVLGLVNIRGHVHLVLDLRSLLGMQPKPVTCDSRLVLFKSTVGSSFGVVVDSIAEIETISTDRIEALANGDQASLTSAVTRVDLIAAIAKLPEELLLVLNPNRFLTIVEQGFV